jgi:hypothetical protein
MEQTHWEAESRAAGQDLLTFYGTREPVAWREETAYEA